MAFKETGVVLVGAGGTARAWLEAYKRQPEVRIVGIYDPDSSWAEKLAAQLPETLVFRSLDEVLANPDVLAAEINLPAEQALAFAVQCLESGIAVGLRSTAVISGSDVESLLEKRKKRQPVRLFSPAFYYPPVAQAREAIAEAALGDIQTLRIKSVFGLHGASEQSLMTYLLPSHPELCGPEYEALPLMYLLGEVRSVFAFRRKDAMVITWISSDKPGGSRYGVYEALRAPQLIIRGKFEPVEETYEAAGTDGYLFGALRGGLTREHQALAFYIRDSYSQPLMKSEEDPQASFDLAAADLLRAVRGKSPAQFGVEWIRELGFLRDAIRESIEGNREVKIGGE